MNVYEYINNADDIQTYQVTGDTLPWLFIQNLPINVDATVNVNDTPQSCTFNIDENGYMSYQGFTCNIGDIVDFQPISGIQLSHV